MAERGEPSHRYSNRDDVSEVEIKVNEECGNAASEDAYQVDLVESGDIMFEELTQDEVRRYHFSNVSVVYEFFNEYGKARGFSIRKHKVLRSKGDRTVGDILWKSFVCSRHGVRDSKHFDNPDRKREARCITRCGCNVEFCVHIDAQKGRWFVSLFNDERNHELIPEKYLGCLRSHRRMTDADLAEMNSMRRVGINTPICLFCSTGWWLCKRWVQQEENV